MVVNPTFILAIIDFSIFFSMPALEMPVIAMLVITMSVLALLVLMSNYYAST